MVPLVSKGLVELLPASTDLVPLVSKGLVELLPAGDGFPQLLPHRAQSHHVVVHVRLFVAQLGEWRESGGREGSGGSKDGLHSPLMKNFIKGVRNVLKVSELNNRVKEREYQESLRGKYEVWRGRECGEGMGKVQRYSNGVYQ